MSITAKEMNSGQKLIMTVITFAPNWWRKNSLSKTKIESADNNEEHMFKMDGDEVGAALGSAGPIQLISILIQIYWSLCTDLNLQNMFFSAASFFCILWPA